VPGISRFLGIVIGMFYREHGVPHFHAVYGEHEISVELEPRPFTASFRRGRFGSCLNGRLCIGKNCSMTGNSPGKASR